MMGRGLSPLQKDILKKLAEAPRDSQNLPGLMTTHQLARRCSHGIGQEAATSRSLRRLRERGLVLGHRQFYRLNPAGKANG